MKHGYIFSIDIGTTRLKYGLYDSELKNICSLSKFTPVLKPGCNTIDALDIYNAIVLGIKEFFMKNSDYSQKIEVIAVDGQMGGIVGIDENWYPVTGFDPPINNNFKYYLNIILSEYSDLIIKSTGSIPINTAKIIYWMNNCPEIFTKIKKFITLAGYIIGKLVGLNYSDAFIDRTSTYLFGLKSGINWSEKICNLLSIPMNILPTIKEPVEIVGNLTEDISLECGLPRGIPLIAGCGDTVASLTGVGLLKDNQMIDIAGTNSIFGICTHKNYIDNKYYSLLKLESVIPGINYLVGIGFGGELLKWFIEYIAQNKIDNINFINEISEKAAKIPNGYNRLIFFPFLGGSLTPPDDFLRGTWLGLNWNHQIHHMYRSVLESIAYEYYFYKKIYQELNIACNTKEIYVVGGCSKYNLWNQIKADILGLNYIKLKQNDYECLGSALTGAMAVGICENINEIFDKNREIEEVYSFDLAGNEAYKESIKTYLGLKKMLYNIYHNEFYKL